MIFILPYIGCQKNGDDVQNMHTIVRASNQSFESPPDWHELENLIKHPRTDCGYFQLGKYKKILSLKLCHSYLLIFNRKRKGFYLTQLPFFYSMI
jgi:hypothetical protein